MVHNASPACVLPLAVSAELQACSGLPMLRPAWSHIEGHREMPWGKPQQLFHVVKANPGSDMISTHIPILIPILTVSHAHFATAINASIDTDPVSLFQAVYHPLQAL